VGKSLAKYNNWSNSSLSELINYIEQKKQIILKKHLSDLQQRLNKMVNINKEHNSLLIALQEAFMTVKMEIDAHFAREWQLLTPYIHEIDSYQKYCEVKPVTSLSSIKDIANLIESEHDQLENILLKNIRNITSNYQVTGDSGDAIKILYDKFKELEEEISEHIRLITDFLFPKLVELEIFIMHRIY